MAIMGVLDRLAKASALYKFHKILLDNCLGFKSVAEKRVFLKKVFLTLRKKYKTFEQTNGDRKCDYTACGG